MLCASKTRNENQFFANEQLHDEEGIRKAKIGIAFCGHNLARICTLQSQRIYSRMYRTDCMQAYNGRLFYPQTRK